MPKLNPQQAQQARESDSFELLDAGVYLAQLTAVTEKRGKESGAPYWEWEFLLEQDEFGNELSSKSKIWENTSLSEQAIWRVNQMFEAFELDAETDTEEMLGLYVMVNVGQEVIEVGSRAGQLRNMFISAFPVPE